MEIYALIFQANDNDKVILISGKPNNVHVGIKAYVTADSAVAFLLPPANFEEADPLAQHALKMAKEFYAIAKPFVIKIDRGRAELDKYLVRKDDGSMRGCSFGMDGFFELHGMVVNNEIEKLKVVDVQDKFTRHELTHSPISSN